ncbi:MAG: hypothetical protein LUD81_08280 [Clostridiales bacterium]|nr:hypothetical protein [Clostridiales bacterium]
MKKVFLLIALLVLGQVNAYGAEGASAAAEEAAEESVYDMPVYDGETDEFFKNSAFVGDSIMLGYKNYCLSKDDGFMGNPLFLASGSFSLWQAVSPVSSDSLHPLYQGEKTLVEDAVVKSGSEKVFICLGTNDLG